MLFDWSVQPFYTLNLDSDKIDFKNAFEIRRAYESARRDYAAESFPLEVQRELAEPLREISTVLDEAFRVLRDDRVRGQYLTHLRPD